MIAFGMMTSNSKKIDNYNVKKRERITAKNNHKMLIKEEMKFWNGPKCPGLKNVSLETKAF